MLTDRAKRCWQALACGTGVTLRAVAAENFLFAFTAVDADARALRAIGAAADNCGSVIRDQLYCLNTSTGDDSLEVVARSAVTYEIENQLEDT